VDECQNEAMTDKVCKGMDNSIDIESAMVDISIHDSDPCAINHQYHCADSDSIIETSLHQCPCCAICLERFIPGDEISYSIDPLCNHEYHMTCIIEWLMKHPNCPYCRRLYIPLPPPPTSSSSSSTGTPDVDDATNPETNTARIVIASQLHLQRNYHRMNNLISI
jgi:Ring finger domain